MAFDWNNLSWPKKIVACVNEQSGTQFFSTSPTD
jgi:hypothetical protein